MAVVTEHTLPSPGVQTAGRINVTVSIVAPEIYDLCLIKRRIDSEIDSLVAASACYHKDRHF